MNCEEFEKSVLAEPAADSDSRREHANACPKCATLLSRVGKLEQRLSALMAIPVPASMSNALPDMPALEDTAESSDNVVSLSAERSRRSRAPVWLAVAASVALVAVLVLRQPDTGAPVSNGALLAESIVEHIGPELGAMRPATNSVGTDALSRVLTPAGARFEEDIALVSYAKSCVINDRLVPHLVMQGENGPVTILLMPDEHVDGPVSIMHDGLEGIILPVGEGGSVAIIGRDAASVESVRERARAAVQFTT